MHRILIVEDDELIAELERDYLEASGFEVVLELNGTKGFEEVMRGGYDALILDVMLPGKRWKRILQILNLLKRFGAQDTALRFDYFQQKKR